MLFVTPSGEGVEVHASRKRRKVRIDDGVKRLLRAKGYFDAALQDLPLHEIADTFRVSESTVSAELAHYRAAKALFDAEYPIKVF